MMNIPLLDLNAQYQQIKEEISIAINKVLESQHFIMGPTVKQFETEVGKYCENTLALGCASGSDALLLALMALDIKEGDYVITTPFTFFATAGAISRVGATPLFVDIEADSFNIDHKEIRLVMEGNHEISNRLKIDIDKVKAIIPVHLYGQMANMPEIIKIANEFNLHVIEDAAQSIGSELNGIKAGNYGDFGCFSFFPSKNLGAYGDAGLITVKDEKLADKVDILRLHGARPKYHNKYIGMNSRLDAIQAAILSVKLKYLDDWSISRREKALFYNELFEHHGLTISIPDCGYSCSHLGNEKCELPGNKVVIPIEVFHNGSNTGKHIYHQYTIRVKNRDSVMNKLDQLGIGSAVYYPIPMHQQECYNHIGYKMNDFPKAECATNQALSLPIYPELTQNQQRKVVEVIKDIILGNI